MISEALKHEIWPTNRLIEYARNPRKNDHAVDRVAAAIKEFGFRVPIVAKSDGLVIDGHLRLKAAKKLGMEEVPVVIADDMTDTQIKAFRISVNKMAELAEWDMELLRLEFSELDTEGFDLDLTGFSEIEALSLFEEHAPDKLDVVNEIKEECDIKIVCQNYGEREIAIARLGGKKIQWLTLEGLLK